MNWQWTQISNDAPYKSDAYLVEKRDTSELVSRRARHLKEQALKVESFMAQGNTTGWMRRELHALQQRSREMDQAISEFFKSGDAQLREGILAWARQCFQSDVTSEISPTACYRSFQKWAMNSERESCEEGKFMDLAVQESVIRTRSSEGGRQVVQGRLRA